MTEDELQVQVQRLIERFDELCDQGLSEVEAGETVRSEFPEAVWEEFSDLMVSLLVPETEDKG